MYFDYREHFNGLHYFIVEMFQAKEQLEQIS